MKFIAHRGNWCGKNEEYENLPNYIDTAISQGFDVEIDLWSKDGNLFLGHDSPNTPISEAYVMSIAKHAWIHAKNLHIVEWLYKTETNWFWHQTDSITITSKNIIWTYPEIFVPNSVINQPSDQSVFWNNELWKLDFYTGICHDNLLFCKQRIK